MYETHWERWRQTAQSVLDTSFTQQSLVFTVVLTVSHIKSVQSHCLSLPCWYPIGLKVFQISVSEMWHPDCLMNSGVFVVSQKQSQSESSLLVWCVLWIYDEACVFVSSLQPRWLMGKTLSCSSSRIFSTCDPKTRKLCPAHSWEEPDSRKKEITCFLALFEISKVVLASDMWPTFDKQSKYTVQFTNSI